MTEYPTRIFRKMIRKIVIVQHPVSVCVPVNYKVTLSVRAEGTDLNYQWFTADDEEVSDGTEADLVVKARKSQLYVCRVNDQYCNCVFSEWVKVKVLDIDKSGLPALWQGNPHIAVNPKPQMVRLGKKFTLHCSAFGIPAPHYQWYRNGLQLEGKTTDTLQVDHATADHQGSYLCSVSNVQEERWTDPADVIIVLPDQTPPPTLTATDKVALLIGNLNYSHHPGLTAPTRDVQELANLLQQLGFRVVSLLDLTMDEMQAAIKMFIQLLDEGVYGIFYYAGHGFERSGRNYLVAVDAPQPYRPNNCICVQRVMHSMQKKQTALSVVLLDTCRKWYNQHCMSSEILPLEPIGNTIYGYATCEDAEAYEVQNGGNSTGIFTKYLNMHILQAEKVTHVLEQVSEDLGRDPLVTGKQAVEIKHTLKEPRSLTDPVKTTGHTRQLHQRDAYWREANELPKRKRLVFPCGVEMEISFSALFSNVLVAFAIVKTSGRKVQDCTVTLRSTPAMEDIFSSSGRSEDLDSLLLNISDNADSTLRLCALQKLQGPLVIEVILHYTHTDSRLRLKETQKLDVGRPLVASCELGRRAHAGTCTGREGASAKSTGDISNGSQPLRGNIGDPWRPVTRNVECAAKLKPGRSNEPEENDENELQGFTH